MQFLCLQNILPNNSISGDSKYNSQYLHIYYSSFTISVSTEISSN